VRIPVALRGHPVPGQEDRISRGEAVRVRDASDGWHDAIATTGVIYGHDFEVVWVRMLTPEASSDGVPFPAEDVLNLAEASLSASPRSTKNE
jgi:hypothetical protein